jgi:hypothetical protein
MSRTRLIPRVILCPLALTAGLLGTACSSEASGPSQNGTSGTGSRSAADSTRPSFGYRVN